MNEASPQATHDAVADALPHDWMTASLQEIADPTDKFSFRGGPFGSDLKSDDYTNEGVRILQLQDIGEGLFLDKSRVYTSPGKADELVASNIYPGDILLAKMAPVARCCIVPSTQPRYVMCSDGIRLSVDLTRFNREYIFHALNGPGFRKEAESKSTGSTRGRIGLSELKAIHLPIPQLPEQRQIAAILTAVDDKLDVIARRIEATQTVKQGLLQTLFSKGIGSKSVDGQWTRHTAFVKVGSAEYPKSWRMWRMGDVAPIVRREVDVQPGASYPELGLRSFGKGTFHKPALTAEQVGSKRLFLIKAGDLLLSNVFAWEGAVAVAGPADDGRYGSHRYITCNVDPSLANVHFVARYLVTPAGLASIGLASPGGAGRNKTLGLAALADIQIPLPPLAEQNAINAVLECVEAKVAALQAKHELYRDLKRGLMQKLLTGEWRVKVDAERAA